MTGHTKHPYVPGWYAFTTTFRDGKVLVTYGTCASDAGGRALRLRDKQRGDNLAVVETVHPA